jgi:ADP-heptose:LPS heptosyltransferase
MRGLAYSRFVESSVRDCHTMDHYLDLVSPFAGEAIKSALPELKLSDSARVAANDLLRAHDIRDSFVILHPGTARPEKYWLAERWAEVGNTLHAVHGLDVVVTCGPDGFERAHVEEIKFKNGKFKILHPPDLLTLAAVVEQARLVISCDTAMVHLAAAFRVPQIALFGPTNPFHWRPMHDRAVVISAAQPETPFTDFTPRMRGAPMEGISTALVIRATDSLLAGISSSSASGRNREEE